MEKKDPAININLKKLIEKAADFHGHLGPFLVIGVKMGILAKTNLGNAENENLKTTVKVSIQTPFSCLLDGIQVATHCTIGNQRLKIESSQKEIAANFKLQHSNRTLKVLVNPKIVEKLVNRMSEGASNEELAWKIACMPESQLFMIEK